MVGNYVSPDPEYGYSYNGVAKIDYTINSTNSLSAHWFGGQGNQVAPVGIRASCRLYEIAPIHAQDCVACLQPHLLALALPTRSWRA